MTFPNRSPIIDGVALGIGVWAFGAFIKYTWRVIQEDTRVSKDRKEVVIDIESTVYAAEEVSKRTKRGEYEGSDISKMLTDVRFFQQVKAEELREKFKRV